MTARPTDLPEWATTGTKTAPSAAKQSIGWRFQDFPPFDYVNWFWNLTAGWVAYLATSTGRFSSLEAAIDDTVAPLVAGDTFILDEDDGIPGKELANNVMGSNFLVDAIDVSGRSVVADVASAAATNQIQVRSRDGATLIANVTLTQGAAPHTVRAISTDGLLVVVAYGTFVEAFAHDTGVSQWSYNHGAAVNDVTLGADGVYMVGATSGGVEVRKLTRAAGTAAWSYNHNAEVFSVAYAGDRIFIGGAASGHASAATMRAIEAANGRDDSNEGGLGTSDLDVWDVTTGSFDGARQVAYNGRVLVVKTGATQTRFIGPATGGAGLAQTHSYDVKQVAVDHDTIFVGTVTSGGLNLGEVKAYDISTASLIWNVKVQASPPVARVSCLATDGASVYVAGTDAGGTNRSTRLSRGNRPRMWRRVDPSTSEWPPMRQLAIPGSGV